MRKNRGFGLIIGGFFGLIAFAIMVFIVPPWIALLMGLFTAALYFIVISIVLSVNNKKYIGVDNEISGEIILKEEANCYKGRKIRNGLLYLTDSCLIFISREKKPEFRLEIPLNAIEIAARGKSIAYMGIKTNDGDAYDFMVKNAGDWVKRIHFLIDEHKDLYPNEKVLNYIYACDDELPVTTSEGLFVLTRKDLGLLYLPTGKIVANDPCLCFELDEFTVAVRPGCYPVSVFVARSPYGDKRVALAQLAFTDNKAARWEMALVKEQRIEDIGDENYYGYGVDSGTGGFMDKQTADKISERGLDIYELLKDQFDGTYVHTYNYAIGNIDGGTDNNIAVFSSGWGDGCYPSYFGFDESGEPCALVTDFLVLD